jgi:hypothetical protein
MMARPEESVNGDAMIRKFLGLRRVGFLLGEEGDSRGMPLAVLRQE